MRALKTKFPCKRCGVLCEVCRLDEGPGISCSNCSEVFRHVRLANWNQEWATDKFRKHNASTEYVVELGYRIGEVLEHITSAARHGFMVAFMLAGDNKPVPSAAWVRWANSQLHWCERISAQLRELTASEGQRVTVLKRLNLTVINGGLAVPFTKEK